MVIALFLQAIFFTQGLCIVSILLMKPHTPVGSSVRSVLCLTLRFPFSSFFPSSCLSPTSSTLQEGPLEWEATQGCDLKSCLCKTIPLAISNQVPESPPLREPWGSEILLPPVPAFPDYGLYLHCWCFFFSCMACQILVLRSGIETWGLSTENKES